MMTAIPGPPGRPIVFDVSRDGMTIAWEPPDEDGGLEISGYIIERKEVRADRWVRANKNPVTMTRYRSTGLIEGLEYEHRVTAINGRGVGKPSLLSKPAVATDPVGKCIFKFYLLCISLCGEIIRLCINYQSLQIHLAHLRTQES